MSGDGDRTDAAERERLAALAGDDLDPDEIDGDRGDRPALAAGYAADGVCGGDCPVGDDDAPDSFVDAATAVVEEYLARRDPLTRGEFDDLRRRFAREPGQPAVRDRNDGARCVHIRDVDALDLGHWVADTDVALVDLDDDVRFADLLGVPFDGGDRVVPLVVAADGLFGEVARDFHAFFHSLPRVRDRVGGSGRVLTDGGAGDSDDDPLAAVAWSDVLAALEEPAVGQVAEAVADRRDLDVLDAYDLVEAALADGSLVEIDDGGLGTVRLAERVDSGGEEPGSGDATPGVEAGKPASRTTEAAENSQSRVNPTYRDLYLEAHKRAGVDRAFVPHEDLVPVFEAAGWGEIVPDLRGHTDWIVWTPEGREEPLYAYTPDLAGPTADQRERFADLLAESDVGRERFIDVHDGQKGSFDTGNARYPDDDEIRGNYGVKGGRGGDDTGRWLVDIDVDDYDDAKASNAEVDALRDRTTAVASAHTTVDRPGHLYVAVDGDPRDVVAEVLGRSVSNPVASFGEIRVENQYVLGPGSRVLCGCDRCTDSDAPDHFGRYELANDAPPVVWDETEFREFLLADPAIRRQAEATDADDRTGAPASGDVGDDGPGDGGCVEGDVGAWVDLARAADDYVAEAIREAVNPDDRSEADSRLARAVAPWVNYDRHAVAELLDTHGSGKWGARGDGYRDSILDYALSRSTDAYRPVPYWALVELAVADDLVERGDLIERNSDSGAAVEEPDDHDGDTYTALPPGTYNDVVRHVRDEYGVDPGREPVDSGDDDRGDGRPDPRTVPVVVEPRRAWTAAGRVVPDDLDDGDALPLADDGDGFVCRECGDTIDVVRAVALADGLVDDCADDLADVYADAYERAREDYGAPLPRYVTPRDAVIEYDVATGAARELGFFDLDPDALACDVTAEGDQVSGDAVVTLDPTPVDGWRDSDSGTSVMVFPSGVVYDADAERYDGGRGRSLDILRFVALDSGIIDDPAARLNNERLAEAYRTARRVYGAPLPRWVLAEKERDSDAVPLLPDPGRLVDDGAPVTPDDDDLTDVYDDVEGLLAEVSDPDDADTPAVVGTLPGTGKTTAAVKGAADRPTLYLAPRLELQQQAVDKADRWGVSVDVLPVFGGGDVDDEIVRQAVGHVREHGKDALRDRWALVDAVGGAGFGDDGGDDSDPDTGDAVPPEADDALGEGDDVVDLDRATCDTAAGDHGEAWQLAVLTARRLGYTPRDIHADARALFGAPLPCTCDGGDHDHDDTDGADTDAGTCAYSRAWERINDRTNPADLLIGSYAHGYVEGARTYRTGSDDDPTDLPRTVVVDEYPGDAFATDYGAEAFRFAAWLAHAISPDVEALADVTPDLGADPWVTAWLDGDAADEYDTVANAVDHLAARDQVLDAVEAADRILGDVDDNRLDDAGLREPLRALVDGWDDGDGAVDGGTRRDVLRALVEAVEAVEAADHRHRADGVVRWVRDAVVDPLREAAGRPLGVDLDDLPAPADGALGTVVTAALDATADRREGAKGLLRAACDALRGGDDGVRELALWADDGYAHPDAGALLRATITPTDDERATRLSTGTFDYGGRGDDHGTLLKHVRVGERTTVLVDENRHGATMLDPPDRSTRGGEAPLVGLDATARPALWRLAVGERVDVRDIHRTPRDRAEFLRDRLGLTVVCMSDDARAYEGDPSTKDTDGDVALVEALADDVSGVYGPRDRDGDAVEIGRPAVVTSKGVRGVLENDDRLDDVVAEYAHFGDLDGRNDLGDHRLAAFLGSPHYGDQYVEKMAALAGEEAVTDRDVAGRGMTLDYGSDVANAALRGMREDRVMQGILRFARGDTGAVVFARTAALRDDLPVRGEGTVARTYTDNQRRVADTLRVLDAGDRYTAGDIVDELGADAPSRRTVRRTLAAFTNAGYVEREREGTGRAYAYRTVEAPGAGEVSVPDLPTPDKPRKGGHYTPAVRVVPPDDLLDTGDPAVATTSTRLPAPESPGDPVTVGAD